MDRAVFGAYIDDFDLSAQEGFLYYFRELFPGTEDIVDLLPCFSYDILPVSFSYEGVFVKQKIRHAIKTKTRHEEKAGNKGNLLKSKGFNRF